MNIKGFFLNKFLTKNSVIQFFKICSKCIIYYGIFPGKIVISLFLRKSQKFREISNPKFLDQSFLTDSTNSSRMMQDHTKNDWRGFYPKTNVFWLHYLLDKLTSEVYYKNRKSKLHRSALTRMRILKENILEYSSVYDYIASTIKPTYEE